MYCIFWASFSFGLVFQPNSHTGHLVIRRVNRRAATNKRDEQHAGLWREKNSNTLYFKNLSVDGKYLVMPQMAK